MNSDDQDVPVEVGVALSERAMEDLPAARGTDEHENMAYVHEGLGEHERALDWLEAAYEQRAGGIFGIKGSFLFAPLKSHPRFKALLAKMNLGDRVSGAEPTIVPARS